MKDKIAVFLPTRKGSQRVENKNTRPFSYYKFGLLELKLKQLIKVKHVNEIILSTNDESCLEIGNNIAKECSHLRIDIRPDNLASSNTNLTDLVKYVPSTTDCNHILWTHVTSPFIEADDYSRAIETYYESLSKGFDSLMSVRLFKNFLWSKEKNDIINRNTQQKWPRTQDLMTLYEVDSGIFIANRSIYQENQNRVGDKPFLFEQDHIKSFDIDWEIDFKMAEAIHEKLYDNNLSKNI